MAHREPQAFRALLFAREPIPLAPASRHHGYSRRLDHRRALLTIGESIRFILIGVDAAELLTIRVKNSHEKVMMLAPFVLVKIRLLSRWGFLCQSFGHRGHP